MPILTSANPDVDGSNEIRAVTLGVQLLLLIDC